MTTQSDEETVAFPRPTRGGQATDVPQVAQEAEQHEPPVVDDEGDLFDQEWDRPPRTSRLTWILLGAVVAALAFAGGVVVQKSHDASLIGTGARTARAAGAGFGAGAGGAGAGGAGATARGGAGGAQGGTGAGSGAGGSGGGSAGGAGADAGGSGAQGGAGTGADGAATGTPVAVGTVKAVSGTTLTITNFGGKTIAVSVPATATVTTQGLGGLTPGAPVSVEGTTNPDGSVTATSVTSRNSGG